MAGGGGFSWWNVVPTLVGGGISIATTVIMYNLTQRNERSKREADRKKTDALEALVFLQKLSQAFNHNSNALKSINECFEEASISGRSHFDPGVKVLPLVGLPSIDTTVDVKPLKFLLKGDRVALFNRITRYMLSVYSSDAAISAFNQKRILFQEKAEASVLSGAKFTAESDTLAGVVTLEGDAGKIMQARLGELNKTISDIVESLEADISEGKSLLDEYLRVASEEFKDDFLVKTISTPGEKNAHS